MRDGQRQAQKRVAAETDSSASIGAYITLVERDSDSDIAWCLRRGRGSRGGIANGKNRDPVGCGRIKARSRALRGGGTHMLTIL